MSQRAALIWCPFGDEESARFVMRRLMEERLVACGNLIPGTASIFAWNGEIGEQAECGVLFKTAAARLDEAMERLESLHPYEQPAIIGWTAHACEGTMAWLKAETGQALGKA